MKRRAAALLVAVLAAGAPATAGAGRWHGGHYPRHHGHAFHRHGPSVFLGFGYYPYAVPYYYPYPYVIYPPPSPPPPGGGWGGPPPEEQPPEGRPEEPSGDEERATYGLVQLHGVPDGADVDLDGRFWLRARDLDQRWLALPEGTHTLVVRVQEGAPLERRVDVAAGRMQVVRFDGGSRPRT